MIARPKGRVCPAQRRALALRVAFTLLSCLAVSTGIASSQAPLAPALEKGSLGGTVVNRVTGAPVKKAQVAVWPMQGQVQGGTNIYADASGRFELDDIPPGRYAVTANHPNFPQIIRHGRAPENLEVELHPGERKSDVVIALTPAAALNGRALDEFGELLQGCFAQLLQWNWQRGKKKLMGSAGSQTNDLGEYRISNVTPGRYYLTARCEGGLPSTRPLAGPDPLLDIPTEAYTVQYYPGSESPAGATMLTLNPGTELQGMDFRMRARPVVRVRGLIRIPARDGPPPEMQVMLVPKDPAVLNTGMRGGNIEPLTRRFSITSVEPGSYWLVANTWGEGRQYGARESVDVGNAPVDGVVLTLSAGADISGTVEVEGGGKDRETGPGPALASAGSTSEPRTTQPGMPPRRVLLVPTDDFAIGNQPNVEVREDGSFTLPNVLPGSWEVNVQPLSPGTYVKSIFFGDQELQGRKLQITSANAGQIRIVLGTRPAEVGVTVQGLDPNGKTGAMVALISDDNPGEWANLTATDPQGHLQFSGVAPGSYRLYAFEGFDSSVTQNLDVLKTLESRSEHLRLEEGTKLSLQLQIIPMKLIDEIEDQVQ